jgi:NAD(P)-dependent dehydrogenase (short-subunit alcohol dehydrogenase family)
MGVCRSESPSHDCAEWKKDGTGLERSRMKRELIKFYSMTAAYLDAQPHLYDKWSGLNPLGRLGRPDELRGVIAWLASDASTFCTGSE